MSGAAVAGDGMVRPARAAEAGSVWQAAVAEAGVVCCGC